MRVKSQLLSSEWRNKGKPQASYKFTKWSEVSESTPWGRRLKVIKRNEHTAFDFSKGKTVRVQTLIEQGAGGAAKNLSRMDSNVCGG